MIESNMIIAIVSALIGSGLGFLAKSYFLRLDFRHKLVDMIVTRYLDIRNEISEIVSDCAVTSKVNDESWRVDKINRIGKTYYKYFDYVPNEIIRELICLQSCLKVKGDYLYKIRGTDLVRVKDDEIEDFCCAISSFGNYAPAIYFNLVLSDIKDRKNYRVEYQARHVLMMINRFFIEKNLSSIEFFKPKNYSNDNSKANKALHRTSR